MTIFKYLCMAGLLCSLVGPVTAQNRDALMTPAEPFRLKPGSSFSASGATPRKRAPAGISTENITWDFQEAMDIIRGNYIAGKNLDAAEMTKSSIDAMLKALDPHSAYYDANEYLELLGEHKSEYSGTGMSISNFSKRGEIGTYIVSIYPGSPASQSNLQFGDRIIAVNGVNIANLQSAAVRNLVRGRRGTAARLTIERADTLGIETVEIKRDRVHQASVPKGYLLNGGIGYINLTKGFSNTTYAEMEIAIADLKNRGMKNLILDLRGNSGGILDQAVKVAERFLPAGSIIASQKGRSPADNRTWKSNNKSPATMPLIVLIDSESASAAEVVAGALQDNDRALMVGGKTFGKGLVQSVLSLPDGSGLTLTASRYYTPSGRSIQRDYSDGNLYDYYNHKIGAEIERSIYVSRTITGRKVYGGDGIAPDEPLETENLSSLQIALLDPLFFITREIVNGRVPVDAFSARETFRQSREQIVAGNSIVSLDVRKSFAEFVKKESPGEFDAAALTAETTFITRQLDLNFALAAYGADAANTVRISADPQIKRAAELFAKAGDLAKAALKARDADPK